MTLRRAFTFICILSLILFKQTLAQPARHPIVYYKPADYKGGLHNYAFVQGKRGLIYVGNEEMVLEYDGLNWKNIPIKSGVNVYSLGVDTLNRVFVGGNNEFGYLSPDNSGKLKYNSLSVNLPAGSDGFGDILKIHTFSKGVFFVSPSKVFYWNGNNFKVHTPPNFIRQTFFINNRLYAFIETIGLTIFDSGKFISLPFGDELLKQGFVGMIKYRKDQFLVLTKEKGFSLYNTPVSAISISKIEASSKPDKNLFDINNDFDFKLKDYEPYGIELLDNDRFAVYTHLGGIFVFDKTFKLKTILNKSKGLKFNRVRSIFADRENFLWVGFENGMNRIDYKSPYSIYNESSGIEGSALCVKRFKDKLYVGTTNGIFIERIFKGQLESEVEQKVFIPFNNISSSVNKFMVIDDVLYCISSDGLYRIDNSSYRAELIVSGDFNQYLILHETNEIMLSGPKGVFLYDLEKVKGAINFKFRYQFPNLPTDITNWQQVDHLSNDETKVIYASTFRNGLAKIVFNNKDGQADIYWLNQYNDKDLEQTYLIGIKNKFYVGSGQGVLEIDPNFILRETKDFGEELTPKAHRKILKLFKMQDGDLWVQSLKDDKYELGICNFNGVNYADYDKGVFKGVDLGAVNDIFDDKQSEKIWFAGFEGLESFHEDIFDNFDIPPRVLIRSVYANYDSLIFGGNHSNKLGFISTKQDPTHVLTLSSDYNALTFIFCAVNAHNEENIYYSYMLDGLNSNWSPWTNNTKIDFSNLNKGKYVFKVKARSASGKESKIDTYTFYVLAPWYLTTWAFIAYLLFIAGIVFTIFRISLNRVNTARIRLEKLVKERTFEVLIKNKELEEQRNEIEQKNKDLTDSINYAQRIQQAILPEIDEINKAFPNNFVLFLPRDIVSGDFYFFNHIEKEINGVTKRYGIFAAADCTGHGVSGAMMSMMGSTILNEIVALSKVHLPNDILTLLNERLQNDLKQGKTDSLSRDGMDIALCTVDMETMEMWFSGAMRPCYILRNKELIELKGNKFPIGGMMIEEHRGYLADHFQLIPGDQIYLSSDGYVSQFGGEKSKKFTTKRFKDVLMAIQHLNMTEQKLELLLELEDWMGEVPQVDDILVIGVKF